MIEVEAESSGRAWRARFADATDPARPRARGITYEVRSTGLEHVLKQAPVHDLLNIAIAVHLTDRHVRRSLHSGHRPRRIGVTIPLKEPERWESQHRLLEQLAGFASQDVWSIAFKPIRSRGGGGQAARSDSASVVALFSGGLDSLCGAAYLADRGESVALLTHSPPGGEAVKRMVDPLPARIGGAHPSSFHLLSIGVRPLQQDALGSHRFFQEFSRRTRPFFYLGLAAAAAIATGAERVQMSENGAFGASLPVRRSHYGARMTRQGHSYLLEGFEKLVQQAAPEARLGRFENPFPDMTKGEACRRLRPAADLVHRTMSCEYGGQQVARLRAWAQERGKSTRFRQCGLCAPCLVRRAALRAASISDPDRDYFYQADKVLRGLRSGRPAFRNDLPPLYEFASGHCLYMARFAEELLSMSVEAFVLQYLPELSWLRPPLRGSAQITAAFDLQRRFAREILGYLNG
jgi:7-cyano-7-deazaguanine synthase in queuosine biosynthesis